MTRGSWTVVVPMKDTHAAKSRFGGAAGRRRDLAIAMAGDTLRAVTHARTVRRVLVVCDREADLALFSSPAVEVLVTTGLDLNDAISAGAAHVRATDPRSDLAVLPGDLPYLQSAELDDALTMALRHDRACLADSGGTGTTLLTARAGVEVHPCFGQQSLRAHRHAGAVELHLPMTSGLRRDVDLPDDLHQDIALGQRTRLLAGQ